jgi:hypothetical protein
MLQALFALALVIAFLPMFARKISDAGINRENIAIAAQISVAFDAARAFVQEESDGFPNGIRVLSGSEFVQRLEPFGLPLGFVPVTPLGQNISLAVSKSGDDFLAVLVAGGGRLNEFRRAEILSRIGFWGAVIEGDILKSVTGGWEIARRPNNLKLNPNDILVRVPEDTDFTELVARKAKDTAKNTFHTDLDMDGNNIMSVRLLSASGGKIRNVIVSEFVLSGVETDRRNRNEIGGVRADRIWFMGSDNPLTIVRSDLRTGVFTSASIANHGEAPALTASQMTVRDFNMSAGRTSFTGPSVWEIRTAADFTNITLNTERITITSFLDTSRGQDVFLDDKGGALQYLSGSGIRTDTMRTDNIIMRDQISSDLLEGGTGAAILEIRPSGTNMLPDVLTASVDNDRLRIPFSADDNSGRLESCRDIISRLGGRYNPASLSDNIVCQFVMYNRIEHRLEIKKCLLAGGTNCG